MENQMIFSIDVYQISDSIYHFKTKTVSKLGISENFHNPV